MSEHQNGVVATTTLHYSRIIYRVKSKFNAFTPRHLLSLIIYNILESFLHLFPNNLYILTYQNIPSFPNHFLNYLSIIGKIISLQIFQYDNSLQVIRFKNFPRLFKQLSNHRWESPPPPPSIFSRLTTANPAE